MLIIFFQQNSIIVSKRCWFRRQLKLLNMQNENTDYKSIPGWNADADPENEPTYPMKHYTGDDHLRSNWERPAQQVVSVEVLKSIERPNLSAVVGTPQPPSRLSGKLRRKAFKFTESEYG